MKPVFMKIDTDVCIHSHSQKSGKLGHRNVELNIGQPLKRIIVCW